MNNDPYQISVDPAWHRLVDGIILLFIGIAIGVVAAQMLTYQETTTITETIRQVQTAPQIESGVHTDTPSGVRIEES